MAANENDGALFSSVFRQSRCELKVFLLVRLFEKKMDSSDCFISIISLKFNSPTKVKRTNRNSKELPKRVVRSLSNSIIHTHPQENNSEAEPKLSMEDSEAEDESSSGNRV